MHSTHSTLSRAIAAGRRVADRRGSTMLIVISLTGLLALLGFIFYTFAAQEQLNANIYVEAAKSERADVDFFDFALQQLILGPSLEQGNSALHGGRHAILPNMFGKDAHPFNGQGVNLILYTGTEDVNDNGMLDLGEDQNNNGVLDLLLTNWIVVDQNFDGMPDPAVGPTNKNGNMFHNLIEFNDSPVAWDGGQRPNFLSLPAPDVDYTYPDINNIFLAYRGPIVGYPGSVVIIPSFHRPQILRDESGAIADWATNPQTSARVMRPHPNHMHKKLPTNPVAPTRRFYHPVLDAAVLATDLPGGSGAFLFQVNDDGDAITNEQGVWSPPYPPALGAPNLTYEYDVDNDKDGAVPAVKEGIWLDLDFPVLEKPGTTHKYVPLFSFTIYDADALFNLNAHGNVHRNITSFATPFGGGRYVSQSNYGLGPHEVNPAWGLYADPRGNDHNAATAVDNIPSVEFQQHNRMFGSADPIDHVDLANRELFWLTSGRGQLPSPAPAAPTDIYPGRYGEADVLYSWLSGAAGMTYPKAGFSLYPSQTQLADDNRNRFEGEGGALDPTNLPFGQPLDFTGFGRFVLGSNPKLPNFGTIAAAGPGNPSRWLAYVGYSPTAYATTISWPLVTNSTIPFPLADDPLELMIEPTRALKPYDEIFGAEEMAFLHLLKESDASKYAAGSRLLNLAPVNFSITLPSTQSQLAGLRQRFTTLSWNRKNFGIPSSSVAGGGLRGWEFNADTDGDGQLEFPPMFLGESNYPALSPIHPFRTELRRLLTVEQGNWTQVHPQMRLSINGVLDVERKPNQPVDRLKGPLTFRQLTPHPAGLGNAAINPAWNNLNQPPYPPRPVTVGAITYTTEEVQEWWARYDRQVMCRDIYVMLYTLCGGSDATNFYLLPNNDVDPGPGEVRPRYTPAQLREMAQFAVNLVDALDRDNIITQFEFDKNLSMGVGPDGQPGMAGVDDDGNGITDDAWELGWPGSDDVPGWNLDDNAYTAVASETLADREVVFGVESQSLTFSETLAIYANQIMDMGTPFNHFATEWNDSLFNRLFAYVELRNASPYPVTFGVNVNAGEQQWAIGFRPLGSTPLVERRVIIQNPTGAGKTVGVGGMYTIAATSAGDVPNTSGTGNYSQFRVDTSWDVGDPAPTSYPLATRIAPFGGNPNLDLITDFVAGPGPASPFRVTDGANNPYDVAGGWLLGTPITDANAILQYEFVLYRRANPSRPAPAVGIPAQEADNPWVAVDRLLIPNWRHFELTPTTGSMSVPYTTSDMLSGTGASPSAPLGMASLERSQPLLGGGEAPNMPADTTRNTLGANNANNPASFDVWQAHFDRDFASTGELLSLPLSTPARLTADFARSHFPLTTQITVVNPNAANAAAKFLLPNYPDAVDPSILLDNRWYRLFEFVEVPSRTHRGLSPEFNNPLNVIRQPGQINLNTVRHPEVLAGLIDDPQVVRESEGDWNGNGLVDAAEDLNGNGVWDSLPDMTGDGARDWWNRFILSRDGVSTVPGASPTTDPVTGLLLPGVAGSHPFRSLSFLNTGTAGSPFANSGGIENTFLRSLPLDGDAAGRRLFELANTGDYTSGTINPYIRHRILSKMLNNVSTRSNVFIVYVTVGFFEANLNTATGEVRIGGEYDLDGDGTVGDDRKWGFFVIDRSLAEEAFDPGTGTFANWRQLIKYQLKP